MSSMICVGRRAVPIWSLRGGTCMSFFYRYVSFPEGMPPRTGPLGFRGLGVCSRTKDRGRTEIEETGGGERGGV